jgi:UDP-glucose 4-epimerase
MNYLVTGGAGYLGAHLVSRLVNQGHEVVVVDDLSHGTVSRLPAGVEVVIGSINDSQTRDRVAGLAEAKPFDGMFHLAAKKSISESVLNPDLYFGVNTQGTREMLSLCEDLGISNVVFTSSAAVYGSFDKGSAIDESDATQTINAYGESKLLAEGAVKEFCETAGNSGIALRCFNLAGAEEAAFFDFEGENVIPIVLRRLNDGARFHQYGRGLATPDGSCVRDYIHVGDAADAHIQAMSAMEFGRVVGFNIMNVSSGVGTSLNTLLARLQEVSGVTMDIVNEDLRDGETASLIGDNSRVRDLLGWAPKSDVEKIVRESWSANLQRL